MSLWVGHENVYLCTVAVCRVLPHAMRYVGQESGFSLENPDLMISKKTAYRASPSPAGCIYFIHFRNYEVCLKTELCYFWQWQNMIHY